MGWYFLQGILTSESTMTLTIQLKVLQHFYTTIIWPHIFNEDIGTPLEALEGWLSSKNWCAARGLASLGQESKNFKPIPTHIWRRQNNKPVWKQHSSCLSMQSHLKLFAANSMEGALINKHLWIEIIWALTCPAGFNYQNWYALSRLGRRRQT